VRTERNWADRAMKNIAEKLFVEHMRKLKSGENLISQREDVGDIR